MSSEEYELSSNVSSRWPLEPVYWTSPILQTAQVESLTTSDSRSNEWSALLPDMTPHRLIQYPDNFQNGKLTSSFARVRVVEIRGNLNLLIGEDLEVNSYPPETTHLNSFQLNSTELLNSQGMSWRESPSSQLSDCSLSGDSPSHSPKLSRSTNSSLSNSKSSNKENGFSSRRRSPGFILRPRPQTVAVGERLCLKCSLLGHPKPTVTWEKDGELVDELLTSGRICTFIDGNDYQLVVDTAGPRDAGRYAVTARNSLGKQTAAVDVVVLDESKSSFPDERSLLRANGRAVRVRKSETVGHYSSDVMTTSDVKQSESPSLAGSLVASFCKTTENLSNAKPSRSGNPRPPRLNPPAFVRRLSSLQVLEGDELLLQCEVSGDPEPLRMVWKRNGMELGYDEDEVFTSFRDGVARLRLRDVQLRHAGEYVCEARNETGAAQCSSRVTVKARKVQACPRFLRAPSNIRASEGETLTIEAEVEGAPTPEILWSLDGEEIIGGEATLHSNVARLILRNVSEAHSGQYMCSAMNSSGEDSVACRVRIKRKPVEVAPEFLIPLSDITIDADNDVYLRCEVTGTPLPTIEWKYNEELITSEDGVGISFESGVAILTLEQAAQEDSGCYTCVARNEAGRAMTRCRVIVNDAMDDPMNMAKVLAPTFLSTFDNYIRVLEGDSLTLECEISGNPIPEITWTINEKRVESAKTSFENGVARLSIREVTSSHGGHIKCSLSSVAGTESYQARVYVRAKRVAPSFEALLPASIELFESEEAYFECKVKGHPQPRVTWSRDGKSLSVLSAETSYENGVAAVRIRRAGPRDAGKYVCVARNLSGEAESVCMVRFNEKTTLVQSKTTPPQILRPLQDVVIMDGQNLQLECHVKGNPQPEVTWLVEEHKMHPDDGEVKYDNGVATLLLDDVMPEDSGNYKCVVVNSAGEVTSSCHVTVEASPALVEPARVGPTFSIELKNQAIKKGDDVKLKCHVTGNPRPEITLLLNGKRFSDAEMKVGDDGEIEVVIRNASLFHQGVYSCVAKNSLSQAMTSCKVSVEEPPTIPKKKGPKPQAQCHSTGEHHIRIHQVDRLAFIQPLEDATIQDGTTEFELSCRVSGNPVAKWFHEDDEITPSDDFRIIIEDDVIKLVFVEVFPDDSGKYTCVISNRDGEKTSSCILTVLEINGEPPVFLMKPKQATVSAGGKVSFSCRVDGDPPPTVRWIFGNQPVAVCDRVRVTDADASNNFTHTLEVSQVSAKDAGKYSACCRNMLGDVTCTVSLIVIDDTETRRDFRDVLRKSPSVKSPTHKVSNEENINFRAVLRKTSVDKDEKRSVDASDDVGVVYKEVLSTSVKTKALTEEERKVQKAEQKDFRSNLTRKVDTKIVNQDSLRLKGSEQIDFRDEALKKKVRVKSIGQEELKSMHPEQKDFRAETIKSKVVTKAYREEAMKAKKAEQVDFRKVLSPSKRDEDRFRFDDQGVNIADIPRAKWKKEIDHTTVTTRRSRHRNPDASKRTHKDGVSMEETNRKKPEFSRELEDIAIKDGKPFDLVCHVAGEQPVVTWFLGDEEIKPETDVRITHRGNLCKLTIAECFPEDQGRYTCTATNRNGRASTSCYVTVIEDQQ